MIYNLELVTGKSYSLVGGLGVVGGLGIFMDVGFLPRDVDNQYRGLILPLTSQSGSQ